MVTVDAAAVADDLSPPLMPVSCVISPTFCEMIARTSSNSATALCCELQVLYITEAHWYMRTASTGEGDRKAIP